MTCSALSSGMPQNDANRYPHPASVPELYVTPSTKAADPADNPYYSRDFRRMYPKHQPVTQGELATLLLAAPDQLKCVDFPCFAAAPRRARC